MRDSSSHAVHGPEGQQAIVRALREGALVCAAGLSLALLLALVSWQPEDPGWSTTGLRLQPANWLGGVGALIADFMISLLGFPAYAIPLVLLALILLLWREPRGGAGLPLFRGAAGSLGLLACCAIAAVNIGPSATHLPAGGGGLVGQLLTAPLLRPLGVAGMNLLASLMLLVSLTLALSLRWAELVEAVGRRLRTATLALCTGAARRVHQGTRALVGRTAATIASIATAWHDLRTRRAARSESRARDVALRARLDTIEPSVQRPDGTATPQPPVAAPIPVTALTAADAAPPRIAVPKSEAASKRARSERQQALFTTPGELPRLDLLDTDDGDRPAGVSHDSLTALGKRLELKLKDFGVQAEVVAVSPGPVITRFEIQPAPGTKVSKITALAKDLARSLAVVSVRIVEVIPGKSTVGIELPNEKRELVRLHDVLSAPAYEDASSPLALALGNDISGHAAVIDLQKMPHMLVAGTTGSGKSVGINAMLLSLLYRATPEEVRLILVDPKMLELSVYEGIPHLLAPVVTDMNHAAGALRWCVAEMERRYQLMAALGVRNLSGYNQKVKAAIAAGEPLVDPLHRPDDLAAADEPAPELEPLPYIVVCIDEFADMMMIVGKKVEQLIARIAQKARAAGIHLLLATQRPSVDVITGLIKANVPARISFQVSSKVDSRTILDQGGAEQLLGHGDMLYLPPGSPLPTRVHGAFVSDDEVHRVVADWKARGQADYVDELMRLDEGDSMGVIVPGYDEPGAGSSDDPEQDALYDEAVRIVIETRRASISGVQRRLRIGYNRAARLIEAMESAGLVSPASPTGHRDVLIPERD